jgi:hypothetical protein
MLGIIKKDFGTVLLKLNAMRNKFAHKLSFRPDKNQIAGILLALNKMERPFFVSNVEPNEKELLLAISSICGYMQRMTKELGVVI